jgi:hypothetical protein
LQQFAAVEEAFVLGDAQYLQIVAVDKVGVGADDENVLVFAAAGRDAAVVAAADRVLVRAARRRWRTASQVWRRLSRKARQAGASRYVGVHCEQYAAGAGPGCDAEVIAGIGDPCAHGVSLAMR